MGCVLSACQYGSYVIPDATKQVGNENYRRDEEQRWSYNSPDETPLLKPSAAEGREFQKVLETKLHIDKPPSTYSSCPTPESLNTNNANEVLRVHETKLERERVTDDSGITTEKTEYTQYVESTKFQDIKGPVADPFDSISHSSGFTSSSPLVRTPEPSSGGIQHEIIIEKTEEPTDVTDAVVKIQAGVRGYLTRKAMKGKHEKEKASATYLQEEANHSPDIMRTVESAENHVVDVFPAAVTVHSTSVPPIQPSCAEALEASPDQQHVETESQAATKIQAAFRGYKVRKEKRKIPLRRNHNSSHEEEDVEYEEEEEAEEEEEEEEKELEEEEVEVTQARQAPASSTKTISLDTKLQPIIKQNVLSQDKTVQQSLEEEDEEEEDEEEEEEDEEEEEEDEEEDSQKEPRK